MSVHAFIAYLRVEANHEEERARGLRALAHGIASGGTEEGKHVMSNDTVRDTTATIIWVYIEWMRLRFAFLA
jgi:hypothetical protein